MSNSSNAPKQAYFSYDDIMLFIKEGIEKRISELNGEEFEILLTISNSKSPVECRVSYL